MTLRRTLRTAVCGIILSLFAFGQINGPSSNTIGDGINNPTVNRVGNGLNSPPASAAGTVYADWSGIDAMTNQTLANATGRIGTTAWFLNYATGTTVSITDNAADGNCPSGHKCILISYPTASGGLNFGSYIYLENTASVWGDSSHYNPYTINGSSTSGGVWYQYGIKTDSNTTTYMNNTSAQVKTFLDRFGISGGQGQANTNSAPNYGISMHGFGIPFNVASSLSLRNDFGTGNLFRADGAGTLTSGILVKGQDRRDTTNSLGYAKVSVAGTEIFNCTTGANLGGGTAGVKCSAGDATMGGNLADSTAQNGFHVGIRFFAVCTNACANTTLKVYIYNVKVCDYDCNSYGT
jgi:hypothetical protein